MSFHPTTSTTTTHTPQYQGKPHTQPYTQGQVYTQVQQPYPQGQQHLHTQYNQIQVQQYSAPPYHQGGQGQQYGSIQAGQYGEGQTSHPRGGRWSNEEPPENPKALLLRGLKTITSEEVIQERLQLFGAVAEVRLIRDKSTGDSRGFAFVDFVSAADASNVLLHTNGELTIDGCSVHIDYSRPNHQKTPHFDQNDWVCPQCMGNNFARRKTCYMCQTPKPEGETAVVVEKPLPSSGLIVRGLDASSTDEAVARAFEPLGKVLSVRVIRDKISQACRGFCFVEFVSTDEAQKALEGSQGLRVDGRPVRVSYTHRGCPTSSVAVEQAQWVSEMQSYFDKTYSWTSEESQCDPLEIINSGDTSKFAFDSNTGYYFDAASSLYYEPNAKYYYHATTATYYNYDAETQKFKKFTEGAGSTLKDPKEAKEGLEKKETGKPKSTQSATKSIRGKKMNVEIEKWNKKIHDVKPEVFEEAFRQTEEQNTLAAEREEHDDTSEEEAEVEDEVNAMARIEESLTMGNVCLLCKRQFNSLEMLKKHQNQSELHKHNLQLEYQKQVPVKDKSVESKSKPKKKKKKKKNAKPGQSYDRAYSDLNENNIGTQLLQKMGWKKGEGIGKSNTITAPIEVGMLPDKAGLGSIEMGTGENAVKPGDTYQEASRKRARARWDSMTGETESKQQRLAE